MNLLSFSGLSKSVGAGRLFSEVTFGLDESERVGLIGPNGCGKSTLLRLITNQLEPDEGCINRKRGLIVTILDQHPRWEGPLSIRDFLFQSTDPLSALVRQYQAAVAAASDRTASLAREMELQGGFDLERRFYSILDELGLSDPEKAMSALSGGMLKRVALARCLAPPADLMLLDEPTNHLDLDSIEWLENRLLSSERAFILVTHDRWFLDAVCNCILEIDNGQVYKYQTGYSDYLERRAERLNAMDKEVRRREALLRLEMAWLKQGPKARGGKDKLRKSRVAVLQAAQNQADKSKLVLGSTKRRLGGKVLSLDGLGKNWSGRWLFRDFSYNLHKGQRIGVIGPNGAGKTSLLDLIAGKIPASEGQIDHGETTVMAYFDQRTSQVNLDLSLIEAIKQIADRFSLAQGGELSAEAFLENLAFPRSMHNQNLNRLSGGELRRFQLASVLAQSPNLLLMDEPTNDFDIATINQLEQFLTDYSGCLIVISHDRVFLENMTDYLWILDGKGKIESFVGSYQLWRAQRTLTTGSPPINQSADQSRERHSQRPPTNKLSFKEQREYEVILDEIEALEAERAELETAFADPASSLLTDGPASAAAQKRYDELEELISRRIERWEDLAERADQ